MVVQSKSWCGDIIPLSQSTMTDVASKAAAEAGLKLYGVEGDGDDDKRWCKRGSLE